MRASLVYPHQPVQRSPGGAEPHDQLVPVHIQEGRFGNWLENNVDWLYRANAIGHAAAAVGCDHCAHTEAIGSVKILSENVGRDLTDPAMNAGRGLDLHRPHVDEITWKCKECNEGDAARPDLIDVWFDSGSILCQWHYPLKTTTNSRNNSRPITSVKP